MPNIAGLPAAACIGIDSVVDGFDSMNLIGTQHDNRFSFAVENGILRYHTMRCRDRKNCLGKGNIFRYRLILLIEPCRKKLFIQITFSSCRNIASIRRIGNDKHLQRRENITKYSFLEIFFELIKCFPIGMIAVFQLNLNHRHPIDKKRYVAAAVTIHRFYSRKFDLMNDFIHRRATGNIGTFENNGIHSPKGCIFSLDADTDDAVFSHEPLSRIIKGRKAQLILYLLKFIVCQRMGIKQFFIMLY